MKPLIPFLLLMAFSLEAATIAHFKFESKGLDAPLYELTDSSGKGHHGRVIGQEPFELTTDVPAYPGVAGAALDLRGRLDYALIPHHSDFAPTGSWTIEFFIKPALFHQTAGGETNIAGPFHSFLNANPSYTIMTKQNTHGPTRFGCAWAFHYQPAEGWVVFTISYGTTNGEVLLAPKDLRDGKWHHIAVVFETDIENAIRLFVDGFHTGSINQHGGNLPISWGTGPIYVGAFARQDSAFRLNDRNFDGFLDEVRFSDVALNPQTFVVNLEPFLSPPIPTEAHSAIEIQFQADAGKVYRIEQSSAVGVWTTLGYALGEGTLKSFFHRRTSSSSASYRVLPDTVAAEPPVDASSFSAVEIRFPTQPGQLYTITRGETLDGDESNQVFLLGDGAKLSYFERATQRTSFYRVERY